MATIPLCFEFFRCRVDVLHSKFPRSTISIAVFCLQNLMSTLISIYLSVFQLSGAKRRFLPPSQKRQGKRPRKEDDSYRLTCFLTSPWLALSQGLVSQPGISVKAADNSLLLKRNGNWSRNASRKYFWERYRGRAGQLLANFCPCP